MEYDALSYYYAANNPDPYGMRYPSITLHTGREQSLLRRHQWIFSKAIRTKEKGLRDGDIVSVHDAAGILVATGHYQDSSLSIRILAFGDVQIDQQFWQEKLVTALDYRTMLGFPSQHTNAFRLVHGEADELPGLIVDIYGTVGVLQAHSIGMFRQRNEIASALMELPGLGLTAICDKSVEGLQPAGQMDRWLAGTDPGQTLVLENGYAFIIDVVSGQKTGFFLDQRENRSIVSRYASGKEVLNCFSYTGGFSVYALHGGARHVTSVDISDPALTILHENVARTGMQDRHTTVSADVMRFLKEQDVQYDLVICDPPAFAKSLHKRHNAVQAYKRLNILAMQHVKPGGQLFTFSCSQVVDRQLFHDTIVSAGIETGRAAKVMSEMSQGPDHPVSLFHPEGSYLKGLALTLE